MKYPSLMISMVLMIVIASCSSAKHIENIPPTIGSQALYDNTWELEYMSGIRIAFIGLFPNNKPVISFDDSSKMVRGNASCNGYSAPFIKEGLKMSFGDPGPSTLMYCGEGEQHFLNMMKKVNRYEIDTDGKLNLMIDEVPLMRFKKQ